MVACLRKFIVFFLFTLCFLLLSKSVSAATFANVSDTITTSRPSASTPISTTNVASSDTQATIIDNGSIFLASDSATFRADTGETQNAGVTVASMSASNIPSANKRNVYLVSSPGNSHHIGDAVTVPITAMHKIQFTTINSVPASGKIVITFPTMLAGDANNSASPSASTFQLNGLASGQISYKLDGTRTCAFSFVQPSAGVGPSITCTVDAGGTLPANTPVTFLIGCADGSSNTTTCTIQAPRLINPAKTAAAGSVDAWNIALATQDTNSVNIDTAKARIGTIDSVLVQATVDPTLTFAISGVNTGSGAVAANTGNTTGCTNSENTTANTPSSATSVDLGTLSTSSLNIAAQLITITTNAKNGYSLTATSSGHLINNSNGFYIQDSTTPAVFPASTPWYGIHACGLDVNTGTWGAAASTTTRGSGAKYGWPTQTSLVTLASTSSGPIGNSITAGSGLITVEYAAGIDPSVPQGTYNAVITYVVTPTF